MLAEGAIPDDFMNHLPLIDFDLICTDYDRTSPDISVRDHNTMTAWDTDGDVDDFADNTEDNAWNNTSVFGLVTLAGFPIDEIPTSSTENKTTLSPNLASNIIQLRNYQPGEEICIYNSSGKLALRILLTEIEQQINISNLGRGLYLVRSGESSLGKFIKE